MITHDALPGSNTYKSKYKKALRIVKSNSSLLSDEGPTVETLDFTIRIGSIPTFLYFDLIQDLLYSEVCVLNTYNNRCIQHVYTLYRTIDSTNKLQSSLIFGSKNRASCNICVKKIGKIYN